MKHPGQLRIDMTTEQTLIGVERFPGKRRVAVQAGQYFP